MDSVLLVAVASVVVGALIAVVFFGSYFRKRRSEVQSIAKVDPRPDPTRNQKSNQPLSKKAHPKLHSHSSDKDQPKRRHPLDLNTLKGHGDTVTGLCFSSDGRNLATACGDGVIRVFKLDDASSKSFKFLRINLPSGSHPTAVAFADDASSVVVACHAMSGSSVYMYGEEKPKASNEGKQQAKLPLPEIKWKHHSVHERRAILTLSGATATYGTADGSTIFASCSEGTDIILWHGKTGKNLGHVDTNQLKNHMAAVSPNGRFLAAAAFTADVKVWEIVYMKDGSVKEVSKVMQLKGHKSAVTWLCFTPDSEQIITASKDGSIRIWNINVRYQLDEDPKTLKVFPIPLSDSSGNPLHYDRLSLSPDGKILAATHGSTLQWLCAVTGNALDTAEKAHEGDITCLSWAPKPVIVGERQVSLLATSSVDKKVKLWEAPSPKSL
ncbi:PREDICTED: transducin beta-like protein 2 [Tarenaya hassleriana]|uniref:transducin beta-like protein 2 n=1 Tax=Tarenaya hassleriana TaxID=28532 RepID=UPI00053C500A|nr:PREDICTED: transducin beta-like protein 2 [Tarenaya hassleriana]